MVIFLLTLIVLLLVAIVAPGLIGAVLLAPGVYVLYLMFSATTIGSILGLLLVALIVAFAVQLHRHPAKDLATD